MQIDYFCFSVPNLHSTDNIINNEDDENAIWVKTKENELMAAANNNNMLMLFDRSTKKFYLNGNEVDIKEKIIFPRCHISYEEELLTELESHGATSIQTIEDLNIIENWVQKIEPVHRKVIETTFSEFQQHAEYYKSIFKKVFIKTVKKSSAHYILKYYSSENINGKIYFKSNPYPWGISGDEKILLSEAFELIEDEENNTNCREYRAFILNNKLLDVSRSYVDYPVEIPSEIIDFIQSQINKAASIPDFPSNYVLDVGEVLMGGKEVIDIIEYNPISSSGLEANNLLVDDLIKQQQFSRLLTKK